METIEAERPYRSLLNRKIVAWILTPSAIGAVLFATIAVVTWDRGIEHPEDAIVREYWPTDGWKMAPPSEKGMDASYLKEADQVIKDQHPTFVSFLVVRDGYIVWERYFGGRTNFISSNNLYSASKSVLSTLVGIAHDEGLIDDVHQPISNYFHEYFAANPGSEKAAITIHDLMTMRSGIEWTEGYGLGRINPGVPLSHQILSLPSSGEPGSDFNYSSADSHLLSAVLTQATGESALKFADDRLFDPLGINNRNWRQDNDGVTIGSTGLYLTSRDMAAIGLLYLNQGYWEGEQILSKKWIAEATHPHIEFERSGEDPRAPSIGYGYQWWLRSQAGYDSFMAIGYAGQYIVVVPELDLVVVIASIPKPWMSPNDLADTNLIDLDVIENYVIPAAANSTD
jgi:CubicO group peptidase (beta-lactamase class C family)